MLVATVLVAQRAEASVTAAPTTVAIGPVQVGSTGTGSTVLSESASDETVTSWDLTTCSGEFAVTTMAPVTVMKTVPVTVNVSVTPTSAGAKTCTVAGKGSGNSTLVSFTITATGTTPMIAVSTSTLSYGNVRLTGAASPLMVTVQNNGGAPVDVTSLVISGTASSDFAITPAVSTPFTLGAGGTKIVTVAFDPSVAGSRMATLEVHSNDPVNPELDVALSGTGTTGVIAVSDLDLGTVNVLPLATSATGNIAITNTGGMPKGTLTVTSASIGNSGGWITFNGNGCVGQQNCTFGTPLTVTNTAVNVAIKCDPPANAAGTQVATVVFTSDTDDATDNTAMVMCTAGRADGVTDNSSLAYGDQFVNVVSGAQGVMLQNQGNVPLSYYASLTGANPAQFTITSGCTNSATPCTLAAGANVPVTATFRPTSTGAKSAIIRINFLNDSDTSSTDVTLSGNGIAPHLSSSGSTIAIGNVEVGRTSSPVSLVISNTGTADLTIASGTLSGAQAGDFNVTGGPSGAIAPNGNTTYNFTCTPSAMGARSAQFQILSNTDAVNGLATNVATNFTVTCTGQQGILTIAPTTWNFGGVRQGDVVTKNFTVTNTGNLAVTNITGMLSDPNLGYSITAPTMPQSLNPSQTFTATVQFAPDATHDGGPDTLTFSGVWGGFNSAAAASASLNGDGLVAGYDITPPMQDFGDTRFDDTTKRLTFQIKNTDAPPVAIKTATVSPGINTATGEFTIESIKHNGTNVTLPFTLSGVNDTLVVTVHLAPNGMHTGMISATIDVTSDLGMNPNRQVNVLANLTTAMLTVMPGATLDFGAIDVDLGPQTQTITLKNTGNAALDIMAVTKSGPNANRFGLSTTPPTATVQPGGTYTVDVTYTPIEHPMNQFDMASVNFPLRGIFNGPAMQTVLVQGRGIDRHIAVDNVPAFPDTFRNPGDQAPTMPVMVHNTGEAPLDVSAVMVTNSPVFTIVNPDPVTVPSLGSTTFNVKFSPTAAGDATAELRIMNNDNGLPLVVVNLAGKGMNRMVDMGPMPIDLGYTGVGAPVRLSIVAPTELLHVANMDSTHMFKIRSIDIDNDAFAVEDMNGNSPDGTDLPPVSTKQFDIVFTPPTEGDFNATATLYLDMDTEAQATVALRGHAVFVDAHGGGGCSTGGDTGPGVLVLVGVALLVSRRRRAAGVVMFAALAFASPLHADDSRNIDLSVFHPTPATTHETFELQSALVGNSGEWVVSAFVSYATDPLVLGTSGAEDAAIKTRSMVDLGGAYAFGGRFEAGAHMPLYSQTGDTVDSRMMFGIPPASGSARGDLTLHGKMRLLRGARATLGAAALLTLPTATDGEFAGVAGPTGRLVGLATVKPNPRLTLTANLGAIVRGHEQLQNIDQGSGAMFGAGASVRVLDALWVAGEVFGDVIPSARLTSAMGDRQTMTKVEWLAGIHYRVERRVNVGLAVGRGISSGLGTPALRGLFSLEITPNAAEIGSVHRPREIDRGDSDGDGVINDLDKCPNEPEDRDMFDDGDGCPDPDNDHDGLADAEDKCPLDAEDKDGFQDDDGCPDKDNDGDGIADDRDRCPLEAEDKDGYLDVDGCPDDDNDSDGIADAKDKCPNEPETINGNQDEDGCPDAGDSLVVLSPDRLELLEGITFKGDKLAKSSNNVLGQIGATLRAHGEILRVRITSHVQPTKNPDRDQAVTDKRAQAIKDWLVSFGIAPARLEVRGFGGSKPLVPAEQKSAAIINDRLELIILERK